MIKLAPITEMVGIDLMYSGLVSRNGAGKIPFFALLVCLLCALTKHALAQNPGTEEFVAKPLFNASETLVLTLNLPWEGIERDEFFFQGVYPASLQYHDEGGKRVSFDVGVQRRGASRQVVCRMPPLKLRFEKEAVKGTVFEGQKSLKLVTHCGKDSPFEQYYIREMLAYRIYNLITDLSFRVQPVSIGYVDSESGHTEGPRFAFLVEDDSDVAKRNGQKALKVGNITAQQLDAEESTRMALFQYIIGNADWDAISGPEPDECCDNTKLIGRDPLLDPIYAIPNDFDSSGLVSAHYASPPAGLPIEAVSERLFLGYCVHNASLDGAIEHLLGREEEVYALVNAETLLHAEARQEMLRYLERSYEILKAPREFKKEASASCRQ